LHKPALVDDFKVNVTSPADHENKVVAPVLPNALFADQIVHLIERQTQIEESARQSQGAQILEAVTPVLTGDRRGCSLVGGAL